MLNKTHIQTLTRTPPGQNRLARAIELAGVTQTAVGLDLGWPSSYVSDCTRARYTDMSLKNARKYARYFGVPIEVLFPE